MDKIILDFTSTDLEVARQRYFNIIKSIISLDQCIYTGYSAELTLPENKRLHFFIQMNDIHLEILDEVIAIFSIPDEWYNKKLNKVPITIIPIDKIYIEIMEFINDYNEEYID